MDPAGNRICDYDGTSVPNLIKVLKGDCSPPKVTPSPSLQRLSFQSLPVSHRLSAASSVGSEPACKASSSIIQRVPSGDFIDLGLNSSRKRNHTRSTSIKSCSSNISDRHTQVSVHAIQSCRDLAKPVSSVKKANALKMTKPVEGFDHKFQAFEGTAASLQTANFMANISKKITDLSDKFEKLQNVSHKFSHEYCVSDDTDLCKGIQCKERDIKIAIESIPKSLEEQLAEQNVHNKAMFKELSSCVTTLSKELEKFNRSGTKQTGKGSKPEPKKNTRKNKKNSSPKP